MKENAPSTPNESKAEQAEIINTYDGLGRDALAAIRDANANIDPNSETPSADLRTSVREALENAGVENGFRRVSNMNNHELRQFVNGTDAELASRYRSELDAVISAYDSHDSFGDRRTALTEALKANGNKAAWRTIHDMNNQDIDAFVSDARTRLQELETLETTTDETEVSEDIDDTTGIEETETVTPETTEPTANETGASEASVTDAEEVAEDNIEDTTEAQDDSDREVLKAELEADAERLDAALTRSDAEAEAAAELTPDTTETDEDTIEDDEPAPEIEDTSTERETRRERREYRRSLKDRAKNIKRIRKEQKKQLAAEARAKVAQDKREQEILNYNRDQQHGIVKKSRIGSIIRRLKGVGSKTVSGLKKGVSLLNPDNGYLKRYENDTTDSTDADKPSDLDLAVNAINKRGEEAEADVVDFPSRNHSRVDSRGNDEYNEALDRVVAGINERGGDVTDAEVEKVKAKAAQEKAKSDNDDNEKEVA